MNKDFIVSGHTVKFDVNYNDFQTFLDETRDPVYRIILSAFEDLKKDEKVKVNVLADIEGNQFKSELEYTKSNLDILTDVINPYFERVEDYETCAKIMKLHSELIS